MAAVSMAEKSWLN